MRHACFAEDGVFVFQITEDHEFSGMKRTTPLPATVEQMPPHVPAVNCMESDTFTTGVIKWPHFCTCKGTHILLCTHASLPQDLQIDIFNVQNEFHPLQLHIIKSNFTLIRVRCHCKISSIIEFVISTILYIINHKDIQRLVHVLCSWPTGPIKIQSGISHFSKINFT